jgi:uncharacterized phage protein (TIGR01671 family)
MNNLKFRAWSGYKMYSPRIDGCLDVSEYLNETENLMQYIGLKDSNEVEIYEGDIVKILNQKTISQCQQYRTNEEKAMTDDEYLDSLAKQYEVVFDPLRVQFIGRNKNEESALAGFHGYIEVIGNIYENPELLK